MKPTTELVVHPASRHFVERYSRHVEPRLPTITALLLGSIQQTQQYLNVHRVRKLGCTAKSPMLGIERALKFSTRCFEQFEAKGGGAGVRFADRAESLRHLGSRLLDLITTILPGVEHTGQHLVEPRHAAGRSGRPIGATIKRLQAGR